MADAWTLFKDAKDEDIPLFRAALLIAHDEYPDLDPAYFEDKLEGWRRALEGPVRRASSTIGAVQALNRYLFDEPVSPATTRTSTIRATATSTRSSSGAWAFRSRWAWCTSSWRAGWGWAWKASPSPGISSCGCRCRAA